MNRRAWRSLVGELGDDSWRMTDRLGYVVPVRWVLHGVLWESSARSSNSYLWLLRMPLYNPSPTLSLSWSQRVGGGARLYDPRHSDATAALTWAMDKAQAEAQVGLVVVDSPGLVDNAASMEVRAYGRLLEGDQHSASEVLGRVLRYDAKYPWQKELLVRAREMKAAIDNGRPDRVLQRIGSWRHQNLVEAGIDPAEHPDPEVFL